MKKKEKDFEFNSLLKYWLECGILQIDDVMGSDKETIMKTVLEGIHPYKIYRGTDGRWVTYVSDPTKPAGRRDVKRKSLSDMYKFLVKFYGIENAENKGKELTFEALYMEWIEYKKQFISASNSKKSISPSTVRRYERDFENFIEGTRFAKTAISDISTIELERFILNTIQKHEMSDRCAGNLFGYINQAFTYAKRSRYIRENPMELIDRNLMLSKCSVKPVKADADRILTTKELVALKDAIHLHESKKPEYMPDYAIEMAMLTGMRVGELAALKWNCVDDDYIHIDYSEHRLDYKDKPSELIVGEPKNRKHRKIPLTNDMHLLFGRIKSLSFTEKAEFVFSDKYGERHTAQEIGLAAIRRCREAGIEKGTIHRIRRTVSSILNQKLPQKVVAEMLGHTETVNEMYYNYSIAEISEKTNALSQLSDIINVNETKNGEN